MTFETKIPCNLVSGPSGLWKLAETTVSQKREFYSFSETDYNLKHNLGTRIFMNLRKSATVCLQLGGSGEGGSWRPLFISSCCAHSSLLWNTWLLRSPMAP